MFNHPVIEQRKEIRLNMYKHLPDFYKNALELIKGYIQEYSQNQGF